jgi:DNA-binding response OmpR family regulator
MQSNQELSQTILIIDDKPDNLKWLFQSLTQVGFKVLVAYGGKDGVETALLSHPDLILLDVVMPEIDGFEVCRTLKQHSDFELVPIIFMTGLTDTIDKAKGLELGAVDYIMKPLDNVELLAKITTHLKISQLQHELTHTSEALQREKDSLTQRIEERTADLKNMNIALNRTLCLKETFLAHVSHELRTPLNAILSIFEACQEQIYGPLNEVQESKLQTLKSQGIQLLSLINDILDFCAIMGKSLVLEYSWVAVKKVCLNSIQTVKKIAPSKRIQITTALDLEVETIQADQKRLEQIIVHLLSNAIKFTSEGGKVKLKVDGDRDNNSVHFQVIDTGIGIPPERLPHIFDTFTQLDDVLNRKQEGIGLGLSLVSHLTKMHGGSVSVTSQVDQGSCFTVSLPWQSSNQMDLNLSPSHPVTASEYATEKSDNYKILLAEDRQSNAEILIDYLTFSGYQLILATNGIEAVEQTKLHQPDLIIMDIQMPLMNGLEAIQQIRIQPDFSSVPIIAITALAMPKDRERCLQAGATEYLSKPISMKMLVNLIEGLLNKPQ